MSIDFSKISPYEERSKLFHDSEVLSRIDKAKASVLSPKAKDCQRQLNEATSVWAIDGRKFLFTFSKINDDNSQKVAVWGLKTSGNYQGVKTVTVSCPGNIFEAVAFFLIEYFELFILTATYSYDADMLQDIEDKLREAIRYTPSNLKQKQKLLKVWSDIMPRFNKMVEELDSQIAESVEVVTTMTKGIRQMKAFFQDKAPTYNNGHNFTIAIRKDCIEYYVRLKDRRHVVVTVEVFRDMLRISVGCGRFADDFFGKAIKEGISADDHPKLTELITPESPYSIIVNEAGGSKQTLFVQEIDRAFPSWLAALADEEIRTTIRTTIRYFIDVYNELVKSPSPSLKALAENFYD